MWGTFGASAFLAAHQMLQGGFGLDDPCSGLGPCSPSHSPMVFCQPWSTALGTWPRPWAQPHSALSWRCLCRHGEGHLFGAGFNVMLSVSLSLVTIHHTKCPHPLVPRAGADGETQHLCLVLQSLAQSLARSLARSMAGGIGSWLPAPGNGVWNGIVPVQSLWDEPVGLAPACRSQGFGEQGELGEWISCRAQTCPVSPVAQVRTGLFPSSGRRWRCSSVLFAVAALGMALSLLTWEPWAEAPSSREHFVAVGTLGFRHFKPSGVLVSPPGKGSAPHAGSPKPPAGSPSPGFSLSTSQLPHPSPWLPIFTAPGL